MNLTGKQGKVRFGVFSFKFVTLEILFYVHVTHGFFLNSCMKRDQDSTFTALVPGTNYCIYGGGVRRVSFSSVRGEGHCYLL